MNKESTPCQSTDSVVQRIRSVYTRWGRQPSVLRMREDWDAMLGVSRRFAAHDVHAFGVPCQWITAPGVAKDRAIAYFHGGGFQVGSLHSHHQIMATLSEASNASVLGVAYRKMPEFGFPAPLEDGLCVMRWLASQGFSGQQLAVAGDSAGGGLAMTVLLAMQREELPTPAAGFLMSAWTDMTASGASYRTHSALDPLHNRSMMQALAHNYLGPSQDPREPLASPLWADDLSLARLPPLLFQVGEREVLLSDSEDLTRRVNDAGGQACCEVWPGMIHVFQLFPDDLPQARAALRAGGQFLDARMRSDIGASRSKA